MCQLTVYILTPSALISPPNVPLIHYINTVLSCICSTHDVFICLRNSVSFILQIKPFLKGWKNVNSLHSQNLGTATTQCSAKNKDHKLVCRILKMEYFYRLLITVPFKMYGKYGQPKWISVSQMLKLVEKWPMTDCYF